MDVQAILSQSLWAGLFAACLAVVLTAPPRLLFPALACGFIGRAARDLSIGWGLNADWATVIAAALLALVGSVLVKRRAVSPAVLVCGIIPLGAGAAMLNLIFAVMQASIATGDALAEAAISLSANLGKVFATSLAIAAGLAAGMTAARAFRRDEIAD
jgi:uncharacterized membrane protein YjjB (DUF3815 family)